MADLWRTCLKRGPGIYKDDVHFLVAFFFHETFKLVSRYNPLNFNIQWSFHSFLSFLFDRCLVLERRRDNYVSFLLDVQNTDIITCHGSKKNLFFHK